MPASTPLLLVLFLASTIAQNLPRYNYVRRRTALPSTKASSRPGVQQSALDINCRSPSEAFNGFIEAFKSINATQSLAIVYQDHNACPEMIIQGQRMNICLMDVVRSLLRSSSTRWVVESNVHGLEVKTIADRAELGEKQLVTGADAQIAWSTPAQAWSMFQHLKLNDLVTIGTRWLFLTSPEEQHKWVDIPSEAHVELLLIDNSRGLGFDTCARRLQLTSDDTSDSSSAGRMRGSTMHVAWSGGTPYYNRARRALFDRNESEVDPEAWMYNKYPPEMRNLRNGAYYELLKRMLPDTLGYRLGRLDPRGWGKRDENGVWDGMIGELLRRRVRVAFAAVFTSAELVSDTRILLSPLPKPLDMLVYCTNEVKKISIFEWIPASECAGLLLMSLYVAVALDWSDRIDVRRIDTAFSRRNKMRAIRRRHGIGPDPAERRCFGGLFPKISDARNSMLVSLRLYGSTLGQEYLSYRHARSIVLAFSWLLAAGFFAAHFKSLLLPQLLVRRSCVRSATAEGMVADGVIPIFTNSSGMYNAFKNSKGSSKEAMEELAKRYDANAHVKDEVKRVCDDENMCIVERFAMQGAYGTVESRSTAYELRKEMGNCNLRVGIGNVYDAGTAYAVFRLGDPLADVFERELSRLEQYGLIDALYRRANLLFQHSNGQWAIEKAGRGCEAAENARFNDGGGLKVGHILFALVVLAIGLALSSAVAVAELLSVRPQFLAKCKRILRRVIGKA